MTMIQLSPPIPLVSPKGPCMAYLVINEGIDFDLQWICFQTDNRECWTWRNCDVRAVGNVTMGRTAI